MDKILNRLLLPVVFGVVVFVLLAVWSNWKAVQESLWGMHWSIVPVVLALSLGNYAIRFLRWEFYLDRLAIRRTKSDSLIIFLSGLVMSVSPGKFGEVFKSFLLRQRYGTPIAQSAPVVLAERLTDLFALILLAGFGAVMYGTGGALVLAALGLVVVFLAVLASPRLVHACIRLAGKIPPVARISHKLIQLYDAAALLLAPWPLIVGNFYAVLGWFCECLGFYLVLQALDSPIPLGFASFSYALATIAGALTMLPGGIGLTEGSLAGLLASQSVQKGAAVAATFVIRLCTLWFAVLVGAAVLFKFRSRFKSIDPLEAS